MRKFLFFLILGVSFSFVAVQAQSKAKDGKCIFLCDKAEKQITVFVINGKYCFASTADKNLISLFSSEEIKDVAIISPNQKDEFEKKISQFGLEKSNAIQSIFVIQLKEGIDLPGSLKKML